MELLNQVSNTQFLFPAAAVAVVLIFAALVFTFGFKSVDQPEFNKLPLVVDDKKASNKKRKTKEKKTSPNRQSSEEKTKDTSKKSPTKVKDETVVEKPKVKVETPKRENETKKSKKNKNLSEDAKPADFDDGEWEKVPTKSDKKKKTIDENKKDSPVKEGKRKKDKKQKDEVKDNNVDSTHGVVSEPPQENNIEKQTESNSAIPDSIEETVTVVKEVDEINETKGKKKKEKKNKELTSNDSKLTIDPVEVQEPASANTPVFDELGDAWTEAKTQKKSKKKVRKDQ